jgi:hypothetical protein
MRTCPSFLPATRRQFFGLLMGLSVMAGPVPPSAAEPVVLLGLYPPAGLQDPAGAPILSEVDQWLLPTGKRVALAATFLEFEFDSPAQGLLEFEAAWARGYVPFVNLWIHRTSAEINSGVSDGAIREWARQFAIWTNGGQKRAFLAPLQEMNGPWVDYFGDPPGFIAAYRRIRQIFLQELSARGLPNNTISWVFAPNGWSAPGNEFEHYYPGRDVVDIVSFSSYNYGACAGDFDFVHWETFDVMLKPYLDRMRAMAPSKPLFIAETAVVDAPVHGVGDKNLWLFETFTRLAAYPGLRGVVYFNAQNSQANLPGCPVVDYRLHVPGTNLWAGFWNAMWFTPNYVYWAPDSPQMRDIVFAHEPAQIFADVPTFHPFALDAGQIDWAPWIHALSNAGITGGCATNPLQYCPEAGVTRAQMAVFLLRGIHGAAYQPPAATGTMFTDVPTSQPFAKWIEQLAREGITGGCGGGNYCPDAVVSRAEMAIFLMRAMFGMGFQPSAPVGIFSDVPTSNGFAPWIEALAASHVAGGCGNGQYCPNDPVTRQQMAVFLVRAFALPE